jgi:hypothetical protein
MMRNMTLYGWLGLALIGLALAAGCEQAADRPTTYGVTGTVTLDGTAVEGATVTFAPSAAGGTPAVGTTNASGKYSLMSFGTEEGAIPGNYMVSVTKYAFDEGGADGEYGGAVDSGEDTGGENELPENYALAKDSGLTATVTESASQNVFDFPLVSGGAAPPAEKSDSPE